MLEYFNSMLTNDFWISFHYQTKIMNIKMKNNLLRIFLSIFLFKYTLYKILGITSKINHNIIFKLAIVLDIFSDLIDSYNFMRIMFLMITFK